MAHKKHAMKAKRKSDKLYAKNKILRKKIKDIRKAAEKAIAAKSLEKAHAEYLKLQQAVDKAAKSFMSKNTAARYKSNLAKKIKALKAK
jgi:small subunit ribosomal protein S20